MLPVPAADPVKIMSPPPVTCKFVHGYPDFTETQVMAMILVRDSIDFYVLDFY